VESHLSTNSKTGELSNNTPVLCEFNKKLYLGFKSKNNNDLLLSESSPLLKWNNNSKTDDFSNNSLTLCEFNNMAYLGFKKKNSNDLSISNFYTTNNWMSMINDFTLISEISLPGTHDSAAINVWTRTPYATQSQSITKQLESGIRILDIRLKVKQTGTSFEFITCHGNLGSSLGLNEYQSFKSVLDECNSFLGNSNMETIVMLLKVDDWSTTTNKTAARTALADILNKNPTSMFTPDNLPLKDLRNKIYFINRINNDCNLGTPLNWNDNTKGLTLSIISGKRNYEVYVQDNYDAPKDKITTFTNAIKQKKIDEVLLNFATAVQNLVFGVYIIEKFITYLGKSDLSSRPSQLGWALFDYPNDYYYTNKYGNLNVISLIISSNFNYSRYQDKFTIDSKEGF